MENEEADALVFEWTIHKSRISNCIRLHRLFVFLSIKKSSAYVVKSVAILRSRRCPFLTRAGTKSLTVLLLFYDGASTY